MRNLKLYLMMLGLLIAAPFWSQAQITNFPYVENFENGPGGWVVNGFNTSWQHGEPNASVINSAASGDSAWVTNLTGLYANSECGDVESPFFDFTNLPLPAVKVQVWWNAEFSWDGAQLQYSTDSGSTWIRVGAFGDPNNWYTDNTITGLQSVNCIGDGQGWSGRASSSNGSGGWVEAEHEIPALGGEPDVLFRFVFGSDGSVQDEGFGFDDFEIFDATPLPNDLGVSAVTQPAGGACYGSNETIEVEVSNYGLNTIDFSQSNVRVVSISSGLNPRRDTVVLNSDTLAPGQTRLVTMNTSYDMSVLGVYTFEGFTEFITGGPDSNASNDNSGQRSLNTAGTTVTVTTATPWIETFDTTFTPGAAGAGLGPGWTASRNTVSTSTALGWTVEFATGLPTNSTLTGPVWSSPRFTGDSTANYMYTETSGVQTGDQYFLTTPCIDLTGTNGPQLEFSYHMFGQDMGKLVIVALTSAGPVRIDSISGQQQINEADPWRVRNVCGLAQFAGQVIKLQFEFTAVASSFYSDLAIDDVTIFEPQPYDVAAAGILNPMNPYCAYDSAQQITMLIANNGSQTVNLSDLALGFIVTGNGPAQVGGPAIPTSGTLAPCDTIAYTFTTTADMSAAVPYNIITSVQFNPASMITDGNTLNNVDTTNFEGGLLGNYTINQLQPTGSGNYASFADAISALERFGVCGNVVFNVQNGPYEEQVIIDQEIFGAGPAATITFDGGANKEWVYTDSTFDTNERATFKLNNADWITLRNLRIGNYSASNNVIYGFGVHLINNADNNIIEDCIIEVDTSYTSTSTNYAGIICAGTFWSSTNPSTQNTIIRNNHIRGGYIGISLTYTSIAVKGEGNVIEGNTIEGANTYGMRVQNQGGVNVDGNFIRLRSTGTSSTFGYGLYAGYIDSSIIQKNVILDPKTYGMYIFEPNFQNGATVTQPVNVVNNMISSEVPWSTTIPRGIFVIGDVKWTNFFHNSVSIQDGGARCFEVTTSTFYNIDSIDVRNNSFATFGTGGTPMYLRDSTQFLDINYNNFYSPDSNTIFVQGTGIQYDATNFRGAIGFNIASRFGDPGYLDNGNDLHSKSTQLWNVGNNAVGVLEDIDDEVRPDSLIVDIGADEFRPPQLDISPNALASPGLPLCPGTFNFDVQVVNLGQQTIDTITVNWFVNGVAQTPVTLTGTNVTSTNTVNVPLGSLTIASGTSYDLMFVTTAPNNGVDEDMRNDTLRFTGLQTGLPAGTYTIDSLQAPSATNYQSFSDAIADLNAFGICGSVVFNVQNGPYKEQVSIGEVVGVGPGTTITFDGGANKEEIWADASMTNTNDRHVIRLDGADYIILRNLTINNHSYDPNNQFGTYGVGLHFQNEADNNIVEDCIIEVDTAETATSTNFVAIQMAGQFWSTTNPAGSNNIIRNNEINGGYVSISMYGNSTTDYEVNNLIEGNQMTGAYLYGIRSQYQSGPKIFNNFIQLRSPSPTTTGYGVYFFYADTARVEGNTILDPRLYGIFYSNGNRAPGQITPSGRGTLINNFIGGDFRSTTCYGVYMTTYTQDIDVWNNSIALTGGSGTFSAPMRILFSTFSPSSGMDIRNNSFASFTNAGHAFRSDSTSYTVLDYNNYYHNGDTASILEINGNRGLAQMNALGGANSHHGNPGYVDPLTDLHATGTQLWDRGDNSVPVTVDIDGQTRPGFGSTTIDIGADEFDVPQNDLSAIDILEPGGGCGDSMTVVVVAVKNLGSLEQVNYPVVVQIDTGGVSYATLSTTVADTIFSGDVDTVTVGTFITHDGGTFDLTAYTNLSNDSDRSNDTTLKTGIEFTGIPDAPMLQDTTICDSQAVTLRVMNPDTNFQYNWYDSAVGGNLVATDTTAFTTPLLGQTTTYYVDQAEKGQGSAILLTEVNSATPDMIEITNLSNRTIDATGWVVAVSDDYTNINDVNGTLWQLGSIPAGQVQYKTDGATNPWGSNLFFASSGQSWAMIIDDQGNVVDAVFWNWNAAGIANFNATINGFTITAADIPWTGDGVVYTNTSSAARIGTTDNDDASDWQITTRSDGVFNPGLGPNFQAGTGCESQRTPVTVTLGSATPPNLGPDGVQCGGSLLDAGAGYFSYTWNTGDTSQQVLANLTGSYSVIVTDMNGCEASDTVNLVINALPTVSLSLTGDTTVCGSVLLDAGNPGSTWTWQDGTVSQTYLATTTGTYSVNVVDGNGCTSSDTIQVTAQPLPNVDLGMDRTECDSVVLDAQNPNLPVVWQDMSTNQTFKVTQNGQYYVTVVDPATGCEGTDTVNLTINASPLVDLGPDGDYCDLLILDAQNPGSLYDWSTGDLGQTVIVTENNEGTISVKVTDIAGCEGNDTITVDIVDQPSIGFNFAINTPNTLDATFTNTSTGQNLTYNWDFGDGNSSNTRDAVHTYANSGTYTVVLTVSNACDTLTQSVDLNVFGVGVEDELLANSISLFPNPTSDIVNIEMNGLNEDVVLSVTDARGRLLLKRTISRTAQFETTRIDLSDEAKGVYNMHFQMGERRMTRKVILK